MHENKVLEINITLLQIFRYSSKRNREIATFHEYFCLHALSYKSVQRGLGKIVLQFHLLSVVTSGTYLKNIKWIFRCFPAGELELFENFNKKSTDFLWKIQTFVEILRSSAILNLRKFSTREFLTFFSKLNFVNSNFEFTFPSSSIYINISAKSDRWTIPKLQ